MSFENVMSLDVQQLDYELENVTDCKSIKSSGQELKALFDLETVCLKVRRVVWIYLWLLISLHLIEDVLSASLKSKFSTFTQRTVSSLQISLQKWNQSWKCTEKEKPSAKEEHKKEMIRARETVWESRLHKSYSVWNLTETLRLCILKLSKLSEVRRGQNNASTCSSEPQKIECVGHSFRQTTTALEEGIDVNLYVKSQQDNMNHKRVTSLIIHSTKTLWKNRSLNVMKSKR